MKKLLKIVLILSVLALFSTACSKVKTTSLIGTYKSDNLTMTVDSNGGVSFDKLDQSKTLEGVENTISDKYGVKLVPWNLDDNKSSYTFEYTTKVQEYSSQQPTYQPTYYDATWKLEFSKDKETVNCKVTITVPADKGTSGSVDFSK